MRKTNKKGFTLIELLAVIVILAIIIVMAVASVGAVLNRMKKNAYVVEANTIVKALKNEIVTDTSILPTEEDEEDKIIPLSDIELQNGTKSPYGSAYDESSYVKIVKGSTIGVYAYSICIVDAKGNGIPETNIDNVTRNSVTTDVECSTEPELTYVTDMLVWLDGINNIGTGDANHSTDTTTWVDLSGNNYSPTFKTGGTLAWNSNNFSFNGGQFTSFTFPTTLNSVEVLSGNWTIEVRLSKIGTTTDIIFGNYSGTNGFSLFFRGGSTSAEIFNMSGSTINYFNTDGNTKISTSVATMSVTYTPGKFEFYKNGDGESKDSVTTTSGPPYRSATLLTPTGTISPQGLGGYGNWDDATYSFSGNIYSFRLYNRVLSEDEIKSNYNVDIDRFG